MLSIIFFVTACAVAAGGSLGACVIAVNEAARPHFDTDYPRCACVAVVSGTVFFAATGAALQLLGV